MKLQILIPQYKETKETIKPLLDSLALQQSLDFNEIGVIIVNDGTDVHLPIDFLNAYPFKVEYYFAEHHGVSATRNACLDRATADYVMFCDADDMFFNACGLYIIMNEIENNGFDTLVSSFVEETRNPKTKEPLYINHEYDKTFVHGKIHRREYLIKNNIRWNDDLRIHEDSYFNILCQSLTEKVTYCPNAFYLWKWRDDSVCRHDDKYILKTYNNMLDSNDALVSEFMRRGKNQQALFYIAFMIFDAYYTMNKVDWINQENKEYRDNTEKRFSKYYKKYKKYWDAIKN